MPSRCIQQTFAECPSAWMGRRWQKCRDETQSIYPQSAHNPQKVEIKINMRTDLMMQCDKIRSEQSGAKRKRLILPRAGKQPTGHKRQQLPVFKEKQGLARRRSWRRRSLGRGRLCKGPEARTSTEGSRKGSAVPSRERVRLGFRHEGPRTPGHAADLMW